MRAIIEDFPGPLFLLLIRLGTSQDFFGKHAVPGLSRLPGALPLLTELAVRIAEETFRDGSQKEPERHSDAGLAGLTSSMKWTTSATWAVGAFSRQRW